jgi:predicted transcriptional regulator of viral defense system
MKKPAIFNKLKPLLKKNSFTAKEAKEIGVSSELLSYYVKTKRLLRLERGIYQNINYRGSSNNFEFEELEQAANIVPNGVICLISALSIYNLTDEIPRKTWIAISHNRSIKRDKFIKIVRFRDMKTGKTIIKLDGISISIFDRERTIIDNLLLLNGGLNKLDEVLNER